MSWSAPQAIDPGHYLNSISCPAVRLCQTVDNVGNLITYNNGTWDKPASIDGTKDLTAIDCVTRLSAVGAAAIRYSG